MSKIKRGIKPPNALANAFAKSICANFKKYSTFKAYLQLFLLKHH